MQKSPKTLWSKLTFAFLKIVEFEKNIQIAATQLFLKRMPSFCRSSSDEKLRKKSNRTIFLAMKLYVILMLAAITGLYARGISQSITLKADRMPFKTVITEIKAQTGYGVLHTGNLMHTGKPVTVVAENMPLSEFLNLILKDQPITYRFSEKNILLLPKPKHLPQLNTVETEEPLSIPIIVKIEDSLGSPLTGATITVNNKKVTAITNTKGEATLNLTEGDVLEASFVGYKTQRIVVTGNTITGRILTIVLRLDMENASLLDDLVVIGYATQSKKDLTGSVTSLDAEKKLKDIPNNSLEQALVGRLAGVQIGASEGSLDPDYRIVVRGGGSITQDNSPLYIIDGVQVEDGLRSLSPQDIERIDVLKDASATAIYGSRGANGVVIITTKGGKTGTTNVTYNGIFGMNQLNKTLPVMRPSEFVLYQWERTRIASAADQTKFSNAYKVNEFSDIDSIYSGLQPIDWQEKVMGRRANMLTHNVGINGGKGDTRFNFSYTRNDQQGIVLNTDYNRNIFSLKLDQKVSNKLSVSFTTRYIETNTNGAGVSDAGNAQVNGLRNFIKYKPFLAASESADEFDEEYFNETNQGGGLGLMNPVAWSLAKYRKVRTSVFNLGGNVNYKVAKWLSFRSTAGTNINNMSVKGFNDVLRSIGNPSTTFNDMESRTFNWSNVLNYTNSGNKTAFSKNNSLTFMLGQEIYISQNDNLENRFNLYPRGITADVALSQLTQGTVVPGYPSRTLVKSTLSSFFGRGNYSYKSKYMATFTLRSDGSSKFKPGNRWGYFPSGAVAWTFSKENFMKDLTFISNGKLRFTYGTSGNNRIPDYLYQTTYTANALYGLNNSVTSFGYTANGLANPNLRWETTISRNIGLDLGFFNERLQLTVDLYSNLTNDVITRVPVSTTSGYSTQLQNTANTRNQGIEFQVSGAIVNSKEFTWNADFNISFNKNTIRSLSSGLDYYLQSSGWSNLVSNGDFIVKAGGKVGDMWGFVSDGYYTVDDFDVTPNTGSNAATYPYIYKLKQGVADPSKTFSVAQPGLMKVKDMNGDGFITEEDKAVIGNGVPRSFGGLNQQFTYKNFDASFFINFSFGGDVLNANKVEFTNGYLNNNNLLKDMEGRWKTVDAEGNLIQRVSGTTVYGVDPEVIRATNASATLWQPVRSTPGYYLTSWAVENGSFIRFNNLTLGYTFRGGILRRATIKRLRAYATVNNIALISSYSGYDPEVNTRRSTGVTPGVDYSAYPRSRGYILGLNLSF